MSIGLNPKSRSETYIYKIKFTFLVLNFPFDSVFDTVVDVLNIPLDSVVVTVSCDIDLTPGCALNAELPN